MKTLRFTKEGYDKLTKDYDLLLLTRPDAVEHLKKSREMGDLSENGYYKSSRAKLSFIDRQLREMKSQLKLAVVVATSRSDSIGIGSVVKLQAETSTVQYHIAGDLEADPSQKRISLLSPLGKALAGKRVGDEIVFTTPSGVTKYKVLEIS